ncbi:MAG: YCF48-related protein [Bacteroidetes bacterium]|nr:YCF48-related protein [Bacteroidota bacterium]MDA0860736.1 YCF48-related protein [Bacteroidota bacterium]MDA1318849.1 YCF48-related protein [Bacteroidota bacterium]
MKTILQIVASLLFFIGTSQDYKKMISSGNYTVQEIQNSAELYFASSDKGRGTGYKIYKRWEYNALRMQDESGFLKSPDYYYNILESYNAERNFLQQNSRMSSVASWEDLGPTNWNQTSGWNPGVGRITSIAFEEDNDNHIIVGSQTGGVWKSTDGGSTWSVLTDNLSNIVVYSLAIDPTNANNYFWGTSSGVIFKSTDSGATWNQLADIGGGDVNKILIDPTNTNKMYCSAQNGGIFKSTDAGVSWSLIHSEASTGFDIEFKPGDYNTVYASGNLFFKSTDGGNVFQIIQSDNSLTSWTQDYVSGNTDWIKATANQNNSVSAQSGNYLAIFYQPDFSAPITRLISPQLDLSGSALPKLKFSYSNVNWELDIDELKILYKTGINENWIELVHFTAESASWQDVQISLPSPTADYYVAFEGKSNYGRGLTLDDVSVEDINLGVVFSDNFDQGPNVNNFGTGAKMIGVSSDNPNVVYLLEESSGRFGGFYKSIDGGDNFIKLDHTGKNYFGYSSTASDDRGQAPRDMDVIVNPNDANDVHIAGILSWRSTDGGTNFNITSQWVPQNAANQNIGYCHADIDIMIYRNNKIFVGSDGGIFVANDPLNVSSAYYTDLSSGLGIRQFYKIGISQTNPVIVSGGSQDNGTSLYRTDTQWYDWLGADGMETFVDHSDSNILYGTSQLGSLYKSTNQGDSYQGIGFGQSGNWVTPFEQDPIALNTIYTGYSQVYKSIDGGSTWNSVSQDFGTNLNHLKIAQSNNQIMYAAYGGLLYRTTDGGLTLWQQLTSFSGSINSIAIHPTNPNKIAVATTSSSKVYTSSDGGNTWVTALYDLPDFSALALVWDTTFGEDVLYLGMNYGVYYLLENTTSWEPYSTALPNVIVNELEVNTADDKLYAGTYGRGLWRVNLFNPSTAGLNDFSADSFTLFPNPTNGIFTIKWNTSELVTIKIFDVLGKLVFYEKDRNLRLNPNIELNSSKGMYYVRLNTNNKAITEKLILK